MSARSDDVSFDSPSSARGGGRNAAGVGRAVGRSSISQATFALREVLATTRVGSLALPGMRARTWLSDPPAEDAVVLVHGLFATAGAFLPLIDHLRATLLVDASTFTHLPGATIADLATRIDRAIEMLPAARRIHLVGHSLGGIAVRYYVQSRAHDPRIVQTLSIASPFRGSSLAALIPASIRGNLLPFLREIDRILEEAPASLARIPHLSIVADSDQLVRPSTSAILPGAPSYMLHDTGHNGSLFHRKTLEIVGREIKRRGAKPNENRSAK